MTFLELELPWPPSVNHYKRIGRIMKTKSGKTIQARVNTHETKRFYYEVWVKVMKLRREALIQPYGKEILAVAIGLYPPDKRKRDIDNVIKPLLDSLIHSGLIKDDYQIARLLVERRSIIDQGKVIVRIEELK